MKNNYLKVLVVVLSLLCVALVFYTYYSRNEGVSSVGLPSQCAAQAQKTLDDYKTQQLDGTYKNITQQNHFDSATNKCFVLITTTKSDKDVTVSESLRDAYENSTVAYCLNRGVAQTCDTDAVKSLAGAAYCRDNIAFAMCSVGNRDVTYTEYNNFVNQKLGVSAH